MKGYKAFNTDLTCQNMQYKLGKTFELEGDPILCERGFHFHQQLKDIFTYYDIGSRVCEIEALGTIITDDNKCVTNKIRIIRELSIDEFNHGKKNSGYWNSGHGNSGNRNSGHGNSGHENSGNGNSGNGNSGYWNSGNRNSGNWNSGNWNSGYGNSGNWNSGYGNSGNWNSGNGNSGYFNTTSPKKIRVFEQLIDQKLWDEAKKPDFLYFTLDEWIYFEDMTNKEKEQYPKAETTNGYLKTYTYKKAFQKAWDNAPSKDRCLLFDLPEFNPKIFKEISGIDVTLSEEWKNFKQ